MNSCVARAGGVNSVGGGGANGVMVDDPGRWFAPVAGD